MCEFFFSNAQNQHKDCSKEQVLVQIFVEHHDLVKLETNYLPNPNTVVFI